MYDHDGYTSPKYKTGFISKLFIYFNVIFTSKFIKIPLYIARVEYYGSNILTHYSVNAL